MDDWQPGDLALCVIGVGEPPAGYGSRTPNECSKIVTALAPTVGSKWIVSSVEYHFRDEEQRELTYLGLRGQPSSYVYDARCYRKIKPLSDEERDSFLADLNAPVPPAVPSDGRKVVALHNAGDGHTSPASALLASLPEGARAPNREALSGFSNIDQRFAHGGADTSQVQQRS